MAALARARARASAAIPADTYGVKIMNKREARRIFAQEAALVALGFTGDDVDQLRRISNALRRWYELECGNDCGCIARDEVTGKPYWQDAYPNAGGYPSTIPDKEAGAIRRLDKIMARVNAARAGKVAPLAYYLQTDPRGAALYIIRPGDVPEGADVSAYYNRGICVY